MTRLMRPGMVFVLAYFAFLISSQAQYQQNWGTGMYPAQPACGYQNSIGNEASSIRDEYNERSRELQRAKSDLRRLKSRQNSARSSVTAQRDLFKLTGFDGPDFNAIESHINSGRSCNSYVGFCQSGRGGYAENENGPITYPVWWVAWAQGKGLNLADIEAEPASAQPEVTRAVASNSSSVKAARKPAADLGGYVPPEDNPIPPYEPPQPEPPQPPPNNGGYKPPRRAPCQDGPDQWSGSMQDGQFFRHCGPRPGEVQGGICDETPRPESAPRGRNANSCRRYLGNWQERQREARELENEIAELEAKIMELEALTKASKVELAEREREIREGMTEGGCIDCAIRGGGSYQAPQRSGLWDLAGGILAAGVNAFSSYKLGQYVSDNNARLGFQTQQIPLAGHIMSAGWPMIQGGLYGVLGGGGGHGSFGCGGGPYGGGQQFGQMGFGGAAGFGGPYGANMGGNAMWGFPQGMYGSPAGGGMFNVGMGAGFSPGYGAQMYCPVQPCPIGGQFGLGGQMGGGFPGMPGMGGVGGGYNPFAPGGGLNLGFSAGFNGGIPGYGGVGMPYGGAYAGMPGFGGQMGGGFGGMPGMMPGAGGYMGMPGMNGGVWAGTPQPFGAGGQFGGMPGMGGMYGGAGGQFGNYQYQQQMMQAQAQQYAVMAQQQQQRYQAYMAQQQTLSNLYGEMYSLQNRIQSAQVQMQSGGYLGFESSFMPGYYSPGMPYGNSAVTPQPFPAQGVPAGVTPSFSR